MPHVEHSPSTSYDVAIERAIDIGLRKTSRGALVGAVAAFALFRGPRARVAVLAFACGVAAGSAYEDINRVFEDVR